MQKILKAIASPERKEPTMPIEPRVCTQWKLRKIKSHLKALGTGELDPKLAEHGICEEIAGQFALKLGVYAFDKWPKFSGQGMFPVPAPTGAHGPFEMYLGNFPKWDTSTSYGKLRRELCLWLSENLTIDDLQR